MRLGVQLAVLFALLALAAASPDTSVDEINPPPSIALAENKIEQKNVVPVEAPVPGKDEPAAKFEMPEKVGELPEENKESIQKVPKPNKEPKPTATVTMDKPISIVEKTKEDKPVEKMNDEVIKAKDAGGHHGSTSVESQEIDGYIPLKAANTGMRLPPNKIRGGQQQYPAAKPYRAGVNQQLNQHHHQHLHQHNQQYSQQNQHLRADKRKRPNQDKNRKKSSNKKRRTPASPSLPVNHRNKKKDKNKAPSAKPVPTKKPVNRRGAETNHISHNINSQRPSNHNNYANNNNRRKATATPTRNRNRRKQPNRGSPNARRKTATRSPNARKRKQPNRKKPYYNEQLYRDSMTD